MIAKRYPVVIEQTGTGYSAYSPDVLGCVAVGDSEAETRRNVTVRGMDLDSLIGREFRIGRVRCLGVRPADPCAYLEGLLGKPVLAALVGRGGLRADILEDGEIAVGDEVVAV